MNADDDDAIESIAPPSPSGKLTNQQILLGKKQDPILSSLLSKTILNHCSRR